MDFLLGNREHVIFCVASNVAAATAVVSSFFVPLPCQDLINGFMDFLHSNHTSVLIASIINTAAVAASFFFLPLPDTTYILTSFFNSAMVKSNKIAFKGEKIEKIVGAFLFCLLDPLLLSCIQLLSGISTRSGVESLS